MELLRAHPWLLWVVTAAIVWYVASSFDRSAPLPGVGASLDDILGRLLGEGYRLRTLERAVDRDRASGHYLLAGRRFEDAGLPERAVAVYVEGQEWLAAAVTLEKRGKLDRAGELYLQAGEHKLAARALAAAGRHAKAAQLLEAKGNSLDAARLYGEAQQWAKSAELFTRSGFALRAAEAWEKQGDPRRAAECYERHFMENVSQSVGIAAAADQRTALRAGHCYEQAGEFGRAREILSRGGFFEDAARVCLLQGDARRAGEFFLRAEKPLQAADAFERGGDVAQAENLRGDVAYKQGALAEAAGHFEAGRDFARAAEVFEQAGLLDRAASAYETAQAWAAAAHVHVRAGDRRRAAAAFDKAGDYESAARLLEEAGDRAGAAVSYEKAGLTFRSGEAAAAAGDRDRAIALLQRVAAGDEHYLDACALVGRLFTAAGQPELALERVTRALHGRQLGADTLDLHDQLAACLEALGRRAEAIDVLRRIQAERFGYRDVAARLARLQAELVAAAASPSTAATFSDIPAAAFAPAPAATAPTAASWPPTRVPNSGSGTWPPMVIPPHVPGARFQPQAELARDAIGVVYGAQDLKNGNRITLRALPLALLAQPGLSAALVAELKVAAQVAHPHLARVLGLVEMAGQRYVVSEQSAGRDCAAPLAAGQRMPPAQAAGLGRVLGAALGALHAKGACHGWVEPRSVVLIDGVFRLIDVGLGRLVRAAGVAAWAPLEPDPVAGDLYGLAATLYNLITGTPPAPPASGTVIAPTRLAGDLPAASDAIFLRALDPRGSHRPASAEQLVHELAALG